MNGPLTRLRRRGRPAEPVLTPGSLAASLPRPMPASAVAAPPAPPEPEPDPPFVFTLLGGDLGHAFDAAMAQARREADAAIREEQRALAASSARVHDRLDAFQRADHAALAAAAAAGPEPEGEPLPELPPAQEAALERFNAATDAQDEAEKAAGQPAAAETAEPVSEDEVPAEDGAPAPASTTETTTAGDEAPAEDQGEPHDTEHA